MSSFLKKSLKIIIPLLLGIIVFMLVYRNTDFPALFRIIKEEVSFGWILLSLVFGTLSNVIRGHRWQMMLEPLGKKPKLSNTVYAIFSMYFVNALIPRSGEVYRCAIINKYDKLPFTRLLGSMFGERIFDAISMLIVIFIGLLLQFDMYRQFFMKEFRISAWFDNLSIQDIVIITAIIILILGGIWWYIQRKATFYIYLKRILSDIWKGMSSVKGIKNKPLFFIETILIWTCYFFQFYVCLFAFDFTSGLTWIDAYTLYVLGSLGVLVPVPQGIGTWHFMIIGTLVLMGVSGLQAESFALLVHATQTLLLIILGFFASLMLPLTNK